MRDPRFWVGWTAQGGHRNTDEGARRSRQAQNQALWTGLRPEEDFTVP
jgi:hypothetical protein